MNEVLSQNEVNALLNAINSGKVETASEAEASEADAKRIDLTSNDRIIRGRMPTLEIINERMARNMRVSTFNLLRRQVEIAHDETQLLKFHDVMANLHFPACLNLFRMPPLKNLCVLAIEPPLMFGMIDQLLGGPGRWYRVEGREYSVIELRLIRQVSLLLLHDMAQAWSNVVAIAPEFVRTEVNPQLAGIATPTEVAVNVRFTVEFEGGNKGHITLIIPYAVVEPIRPLLSSALQTEQSQVENPWRSAIREMIDGLRVQFSVLLGNGHISVRDLSQLKVGDTICLEADARRPLTCRVEGVAKAWGKAVRSRGRLAVKLETDLGGPAPRGDFQGGEDVRGEDALQGGGGPGPEEGRGGGGSLQPGTGHGHPARGVGGARAHPDPDR